MSTVVTPDHLFQSTDLARRHREVMTAARQPGGALIRDTDGTALHLSPAAEYSVARYVLAGYESALAVLSLLTMNGPRDALLYGDLAWLAVLPEENQEEFTWKYVKLLRSLTGVDVEPVEQFLYEWQQTALAWADADLRAELLGDEDEPVALEL